MRTRIVVTLAALLLASVSVTRAQTPPTKPEPPANVPTLGLLDLGYRGGSVDGDEARFERYRDLSPGATSWFELNRQHEKYRFTASAFNVGYRDQRYDASFTNGKLSVDGLFDSIPMNYIYDAPLIWTNEGGGRFTLPVALRRARSTNTVRCSRARVPKKGQLATSVLATKEIGATAEKITISAQLV